MLIFFGQSDESDGSDEDSDEDEAMEEDDEKEEVVDQDFRMELMKVLQKQNALVGIAG